MIKADKFNYKDNSYQASCDKFSTTRKIRVNGNTIKSNLDQISDTVTELE